MKTKSGITIAIYPLPMKLAKSKFLSEAFTPRVNVRILAYRAVTVTPLSKSCWPQMFQLYLRQPSSLHEDVTKDLFIITDSNIISNIIRQEVGIIPQEVGSNT